MSGQSAPSSAGEPGERRRARAEPAEEDRGGHRITPPPLETKPWQIFTTIRSDSEEGVDHYCRSLYNRLCVPVVEYCTGSAGSRFVSGIVVRGSLTQSAELRSEKHV